MKSVMALALLAAYFFIFPKTTLAAIVINEFCPKCDPDEWVELFNDSDQSVDINGWEIQDGNAISSDDLTLSGTISARSLIVFQRPKGWLNDSGDTVKLYNFENNLVDQKEYTTTIDGKTYARSPDGSETWLANVDASKNTTNPSPPTPTSTPNPTNTPTPTPTPKPTSTPTPAKTPTPTPTKKLSPTPSPSAVLSPSPEATPEPTPEPTSELSNEITPTPTGEVLGKATRKIASTDLYIALGLGSAGVAFIVGALIYTFLKKRASMVK